MLGNRNEELGGQKRHCHSPKVCNNKLTALDSQRRKSLDPMSDALERIIPTSQFVDLYELTMADVYIHNDMADNTATFSLYFRGYPHNRGYYLVAGIDAALDYLKNLSVSTSDLENIRELGILSNRALEYLKDWSFTGTVHAVREGEIIFDSEPVLEVTAPIIQAQFAEAALLNTITTCALFATKATRIAQAAQGRPVIDMGARRTHGTAAALTAARSAYIAGFQATSLLEAAALGIPVAGTMAHSFIQSMPDELTAFRSYVERYPNGATLLVDTYDTSQGVNNAIKTAHQLMEKGGHIRAIRLDSGDLGALATMARGMLDKSDLPNMQIIASGGLDEYAIDALVTQGAPIDAFGVGTKFGTSADAPYIESVYKLVEFDGRPVFKQSEGKRTLPHAKQVYRTLDSHGRMHYDTITRRDEQPINASTPLLSEVMRNGQRTREPESLDTTRARIASAINTLPSQYRKLAFPDTYPVHLSESLNKH